MGYELHIVRTRSCDNLDYAPITKAEVDRIVSNDPELSWSSSDSIKSLYEAIEVKGCYILLLGKPSMSWHDAEIRCKNPSDAEIIKMITIAASLDAIVVGDEGELYRLQTGPLGNQEVVFEK